MARWLSPPLLVLLLGAALGAQTVARFQEFFATPGPRLAAAVWTTETGPASFLGRTQLADWISPGGVGRFVVDNGGARLSVSTFNPTGFSLYGTHGRTLTPFQPGATTTVELTTRLQLTSLQPGLVYATYLYRCTTAGCGRHDEIDIELVTNLLQPGGPLRVQLNRYADEPLGPGHGVLADLPAGFDPLAAHDWTIRWSRRRIAYLVDGALLYSTDTHVPQGEMHANVIAWAPGPEWPVAYSAALQPVSSAGQDRSFPAHVRSVVVREINEPVPEAPAGVAASVAGPVLTVSWTTPPSPVAPSAHLLTFYSGAPETMSPASTVAQVTTGAAEGAALPIPAGTLGTFTVRVDAVSGAAASLPSPPATFVIGPAAPSAPAHLLGMVNGSAVALAWRNTFTGGGLDDIVLDVSGALAASIPLGVSDAFQFDGVPSGTYTLSVRATNAAGSSPSSNAITLTFPGPCSGSPLPPSGFQVSAVGPIVSASWEPATTGPAPTAYVLNVTGTFTGRFNGPGRRLSGAAGPGTYGLSVAASNACGSSASTPVQTIVIP